MGELTVIETTDERPSLFTVTGGEHDTALEAVRMLEEAGEKIFLRAGTLVRPVREQRTRKQGVERPEGSLTLTPVTTTYIITRIQSIAHVTRYDVRTKQRVQTRFPTLAANMIVENTIEHPWPVLDAIVRHPLLLPDGTWIGRPGYHDTQFGGFYLDINGDEWTKPDTDKQAAEDALAYIMEHYRYMAWDSDLSKSVGMSTILTALMRPVLESAPMHAIDAPMAGSGKSLFADSVAILSTGNRAAVMSWTREEAENEKRLVSMLRAGDTVIAIDNIDTPVDSAILAQVLTQNEIRARILGESNMVTLPTKVMIIATGNNLTIKGDMVRRTVVGRLDAKLEDPEKRVVDQDLLAETREKRSQLIHAVQTMIAAYLKDGVPALTHLGSFHTWTIVRSVLNWLGMFDPVETISKGKASDPERQDTVTVFDAWFDALGDEPVNTKNLIAYCSGNPDLRDALMLIARKKDTIDARRLGYWLRAHKDLRIAGKMLVQHGQTKTTKWKIIKS